MFDFLKKQGFLVGSFFHIVHSIDEIKELIKKSNTEKNII